MGVDCPVRVTYLYGAGDVRVVDVPDPAAEQPTDAPVRTTRACAPATSSSCRSRSRAAGATDRHGGLPGRRGVRVPLADGRLVAVRDVGPDADEGIDAVRELTDGGSPRCSTARSTPAGSSTAPSP